MRISNSDAIASGVFDIVYKLQINSETTIPLIRALIRDTEVVVYIKGEAECYEPKE